MKICMFTNTYLPHVGGVARSIQTFVSDLRNAGHRVLVVAPVFPDCEAHDKTEAGIIRVPAITEVSGSDFSLRLPIPFYLSEAIENFRPDIIHSHHPYFMGDTAFRAARQHHLPLVFTHHTLYEQYVHHINMDADAVQQFAANLSTQYADLCDHIIAPSQSIATLLTERGVKKEISVIPTGVDIQLFSRGDGAGFRRRYDIPENTFVIGHLGRLAAEKNLSYLAQAVASVSKNRPDTIFMVVGDGPMRENILKIFKTYHMESSLIFTGSLRGQSLVDAYHAMDLFAFSSLSETQGMVLTEAMAAGVPVIALDGPGVRDVMVHEQNGVLMHEKTDPEDFSKQIEKMASQPENLKKWRKGARKTAEEFSREKSVEQLLLLYESMLHQHAQALSVDQAEPNQELDAWDSILVGIETEWDLIAEKTKTFLETVKEQIDADTAQK
ncbi:glycosyltransferase [Desulfocicer niacini]